MYVDKVIRNCPSEDYRQINEVSETEATYSDIVKLNAKLKAAVHARDGSKWYIFITILIIVYIDNSYRVDLIWKM